ncbi:MAG: 7,8-didemethyl-8-hydroxy-5-deazariboflavin synthase CofG [Chloroflexota bacterium]|nr:7,8-didemethyl-8-hydroxy-5-deazariboflavin synthase CofG [Chloroflexota bacterium]
MAAAAGHGLSREAAHRLIRAEGEELAGLLAAAGTLRDRRTGRVVTYSRKVFIPLTNLCRDTCGYCTFVRRPGDPRAQTMTPDEVLAVAEAGRRAGCKEALFSLGDKPERRYPAYRQWLAEWGYPSTIAYLRDMCALVLAETGLLPHANPGVMTREDIATLRPVTVSLGTMLEGISPALLAKGGAHRGSPDKTPAARLATLAAAGELAVPFTTGILIGIGETPEERVDALLAIKALHDRHGHVQEVIVQNFRAKPDIRMRDWPEPGPLEMVRTIAVARLIFGDEINVQAPPNLALTDFGAYLRAGLNDWGGISPVTRDYINPERAWPAVDRLRAAMAEAGFELRERLGIYPEYARRADRYLDPALHERVGALIDETGLVRREEEQWTSASTGSIPN